MTVSLLDPIAGFIRQKRRESSSRGDIAPWMKYMEIEIVEELLSGLRPQRCLEWGAGYSTLYFPSLLDPGARWHSVEHDREWAEKIAALNTRANVDVTHVPPNHYPWSDEEGDGTYADLADYVEYPSQFAPYDFVLVDGRARASCLSKALNLTSDGGVVVLHDAQRRNYHRALAEYPNQVWFWFHDRRARGRRRRALWIGSRSRPIESVLDVERHQRIWRVYDAFGTLIKMM